MADRPESLHPNQSARDVMKHHRRCNPTQLVEDKIIRYVQCPGEQTDPQNRHHRSDFTCHREFQPVAMVLGPCAIGFLARSVFLCKFCGDVVLAVPIKPITAALKVWRNLRHSIID